MKKNRAKEEGLLLSAEHRLEKSPSDKTLVFLVLAIFLLAVNAFSITREYFSQRKAVSDAVDIPETYVWIAENPTMSEGLYLLTPQLLEEIFPGLVHSTIHDPTQRVFAIQYNEDSPQLINLPPKVANIFFLPISINRADKNILSVLPGIGPVLAERIVQRRKEKGPFRSKDELLHITGIGYKKLSMLSDHIIID